jgi:phospholipid/cholesterol/gamma-HCH transport system ATP-binding protein
MSDSPSPNHLPGVSVEVRGLRKSYNAGPVLKGLDFDVKAGEIFVIMGPSGSGKSVLLKHLIGLEKPDEGTILIGGLPISDPAVKERFRLAMVFQSGALLNSLTVGENVGLYLAEHRLKPPGEIARVVSEKLAVVGLKNLEHRSISELSGGMKKRVAIARALVIEPQLMLFDEPTSELDPLMAVAIGEEIRALKQRDGVTVVVVSHDRDLAFGVADRIALINEGEILFIGTPAEVRQNEHPMIQRFLKASLKSSISINSNPDLKPT